MKNGFKILMCCVLLGITTASIAQSKAQTQVEEKVKQLTKAMIDGDSAMLDKLADADLVYRHSGGHIDTKTEFVHKIASGASDFVTINLTDQSFLVPDKKTVIVCHTLAAKTNDGGKPGEVNLFVMLVWKKLHGQWKLVARQAAKKV